MYAPVHTGTCITIHMYYHTYVYIYICISYVTSVRYVARINHEARGSSDLFRKRTEPRT